MVGAVGPLLSTLFDAYYAAWRWRAPRTYLILGRVMSSRDLKRILEEKRAEASDFLSEEEHDILVAIAGGAGKDEVARSLGISEEMVDSHVENILDKLHHHNEQRPSSPPADNESDG